MTEPVRISGTEALGAFVYAWDMKAKRIIDFHDRHTDAEFPRHMLSELDNAMMGKLASSSAMRTPNQPEKGYITFIVRSASPERLPVSEHVWKRFFENEDFINRCVQAMSSYTAPREIIAPTEEMPVSIMMESSDRFQPPPHYFSHIARRIKNPLNHPDVMKVERKSAKTSLHYPDAQMIVRRIKEELTDKHEIRDVRLERESAGGGWFVSVSHDKKEKGFPRDLLRDIADIFYDEAGFTPREDRDLIISRQLPREAEKGRAP